MKITLLTPALVAILGLALAGVPITAQAQTSTNSTTDTTPSTSTTTDTTPTKGKKKSDKPHFSGSITAIDATSLTVANKTKTLTLAITPKTVFKKDKMATTQSDFAVGDKVSGSYSVDASGAMTANSVYKKTPKTPDTTPTPAPSTTPATPATTTTPPATQ